ncbi:hypothetical protein ABI59_23255 [Acidobacteria bacterium Mor1]|nr:hypothetical protein ABI59_23255 [Acidobacteria bacterium Mor1]
MADIILVGPDRSSVAMVRTALREDGHGIRVEVPETWRSSELEEAPDLVVAVDDGRMIAREPFCGHAESAPPVLLLDPSGNDHDSVYFEDRLVDRMSLDIEPGSLLARVDALVRAHHILREVRRPETGEEMGLTARNPQRFLRRMVGLLGTRFPRHRKPLTPYLEVAASIADWADHRDAFEPGHAERVASFAAVIGHSMGLPDGEISDLLHAAMLHDIGKVALPIEVLRQRGPLEEDQREMMRTHPATGARLLEALDRDDRVAETVLYHHEQPSGTGYYHVESAKIPRTAAILGVAEAYDAMTSTMLQEPLSNLEALEALRSRRGDKWDADAVDALAEALAGKQIGNA